MEWKKTGRFTPPYTGIGEKKWMQVTSNENNFGRLKGEKS